MMFEFDDIIRHARQTVGADRALAGKTDSVDLLVGSPNPDPTVRYAQVRAAKEGNLVFNETANEYELPKVGAR